jgi:excisionase family DNA binding protein
MPATEPPAHLAAYSVTEAARQLSISRTHLYKLIDDGLVRRVRLGKRIVIAAAELDRVLEDNVEEADRVS